MAASFLWFGGFAAAGGEAMAALTGLPGGWPLGRAEAVLGLPVGRGLVRGVALLAHGLRLDRARDGNRGGDHRGRVSRSLAFILECARACRRFLTGLFVPSWPEGRSWDPRDATQLLTAVSFAGLGGFWTLFYSSWLREKGAGMAVAHGPDHEPDHRQAGVHRGQRIRPRERAGAPEQAPRLDAVPVGGRGRRRVRQSAHDARDVSSGVGAVVSGRQDPEREYARSLISRSTSRSRGATGGARCSCW